MIAKRMLFHLSTASARLPIHMIHESSGGSADTDEQLQIMYYLTIILSYAYSIEEKALRNQFEVQAALIESLMKEERTTSRENRCGCGRNLIGSIR